MPKKIKLSASDKNFLSVIKKAALENPFSEERRSLDIMITGISSSESGDKTTAGLIKTVTSKVAELEKKGIKNIYSVQDEDRKLVELLVLFYLFYRYKKDFDDFIYKQIHEDKKNLRLEFAAKAKTELEKWGFSQASIKNCFEEAFQLRRAFFFIKKSIIGKSPVMKSLRKSLWENVFTHNIDIYKKYLKKKMEDFSTLILGDTGTGKGAAASAIGRSGYIPFDMKKLKFKESFTSSFISINLSQFPQTLIESELFGHKKGAFTGAFDNYSGVFKRCSPYGAIFLDETGDISIPVQVKLLQVLQDRIFYPVGSYEKERFYGRVIAATNLSLDNLRKEGKFRDDLYYRLCSDIIVVPTLYERIQSYAGELTDLINFLIERMLGRPSPELADMVNKTIDKKLGKQYLWPGNVRELEQCIRSVIIKKDYKGDTLCEISSPSKISNHLHSGTLSAKDLVKGYCKILYERYGTFEEVAKKTSLDRRTVNKYIKEWDKKSK